jgi:protein O-mannosyl-transferase
MNLYNTETQLISDGQSETLIDKSKNKFILFYLSLIIVLTFIAYSSSLRNEIISWDDDVQIVNNNDIKELTFNNISKIFTNRYFGLYQPLNILSYALEYNFFKLNPLPYHTDNLIIHLLNVILVFFFIYSLTNKLNISVIVALFFGIHPLNVESVAWISARSNIMCAFFFISGLITYIYYVKSQQSKFKRLQYLVYTYILFILSLLSKSVAVSFPLIIILIDYYLTGFKFQVSSFKSQVNKLPFFLIAIIFGIIGILVQKSSSQILGIDASYTIFDRTILVAYSASFYIIKLFIPMGLSPMHYYPVKSGGMLPIGYYLSAALSAGIVISIILIKPSKLRKDIIFGTLFYLATIVLVLQIIPIRLSLNSERYSYIPMIGLIFAIGKICLTFYDLQLKQKSNKLKPVMIPVMLIAALIYSFLTHERCKVWANNFSLFNDIAKQNPRSYLAFNNRGIAKASFNDYKGAIEDYNKVIENNPKDAGSMNNRGLAKNALGDYQGAIMDYNRAIEINPRYSEAYNNRALAKSSLGDKLGALQDCNKAIELNPQYAGAFNNRAGIKDNLGDKQGALQDYNKAIEIDPKSSKIFYNRALVKDYLGDKHGAIQDYNSVLEINPKDTLVLLERGKAKCTLGDMQGAMQDFNKAIEINPGYADAINNRGIVKGSLGDKQGALDDYNKAIELKPQNAQAYNNRGNAKGSLGNIKGALEDFNKAIELNPKYAFAYYNRGNARYFLRDKEGACTDWRYAGELGKKEAYDLISKYCK